MESKKVALNLHSVSLTHSLTTKVKLLSFKRDNLCKVFPPLEALQRSWMKRLKSFSVLKNIKKEAKFDISFVE